MPYKVVHSDENHIWYREGTTDLERIQEQPIYRELFFNDIDTALDVGAHIGAFARYAIQFVKRVVCVEPEKDNFSMLLRNIEDLNTIIPIRAAVTDDKKLLYGGSAAFRLASNLSAHHLGVSTLRVPVISFRKLICVFEPDAIKIDIEKEERKLDFQNLPPFVKSIAIEYHPASSGRRVHEILLKQNFDVVRLPNFLKGTNDVGIYRRVKNA